MPYHSELCRSRSTRPGPAWLVKLAPAALSEIRTTEKLWHSGCNSTRTRRQSHHSNFSMWKSRKGGNLSLDGSEESVAHAQFSDECNENTNAPLAPRAPTGRGLGHPRLRNRQPFDPGLAGVRACFQVQRRLEPFDVDCLQLSPLVRLAHQQRTL